MWSQLSKKDRQHFAQQLSVLLSLPHVMVDFEICPLWSVGKCPLMLFAFLTIRSIVQTFCSRISRRSITRVQGLRSTQPKSPVPKKIISVWQDKGTPQKDPYFFLINNTVLDRETTDSPFISNILTGTIEISYLNLISQPESLVSPEQIPKSILMVDQNLRERSAK